jgi:Beta-carotene isomerase D27-like, C-terminal
MNAWATMLAGTWLMGECEINDVEVDGGEIGIGQGLLVKRCRFLEESGCASVCVNSCKIPTQNFFLQDMGLPLTMTPDYETYECQFSFGMTPSIQSEVEAKNTPCLSRCPSAGGMRKWHDGSMVTPSQCSLMENETTEQEHISR